MFCVAVVGYFLLSLFDLTAPDEVNIVFHRRGSNEGIDPEWRNWPRVTVVGIKFSFPIDYHHCLEINVVDCSFGLTVNNKALVKGQVLLSVACSVHPYYLFLPPTTSTAALLSGVYTRHDVYSWLAAWTASKTSTMTWAAMGHWLPVVALIGQQRTDQPGSQTGSDKKRETLTRFWFNELKQCNKQDHIREEKVASKLWITDWLWISITPL